MSSGRDEADERFAAAWDERMRGGAPGRRAHPGAPGAPFGDHPRTGDRNLDEDLRIADLLTRAGRATPGPDPDASQRMRAGLMAALAEEPAPTGSPRTGVTRHGERVTPTGASHGRRRAARRGATRPGDGRPDAARTTAGPGRSRHSSTVRRLLSTTVAGMACVLALGALTVLLSRGALPGDMLYGLKRASESTEIGLTSGQEAQARKHLDVAALRLDEIQQLLQRDATTASGARPTAAGPDDADAALVADNLRAFDEQARAGAKMLLPLINQPAGPPPGLLSQWAGQQQHAIDGFSPSLSPSGREQADSSQRLVTQLRERATTFEKAPGSCGGSTSDELGPLPSSACAAGSDRGPVVAAPQTPASPSTKTSTSTTRRTTTESSTTTTESSTSRSSEPEDRTIVPPTTTTPAPIQVPVPVPGLPKVQLPPLLPGLPGLSLG